MGKLIKLCKCGSPVRAGLLTQTINGKKYTYTHYDCTPCAVAKNRLIRARNKKKYLVEKIVAY